MCLFEGAELREQVPVNETEVILIVVASQLVFSQQVTQRVSFAVAVKEKLAQLFWREYIVMPGWTRAIKSIEIRFENQLLRSEVVILFSSRNRRQDVERC